MAYDNGEVHPPHGHPRPRDRPRRPVERAMVDHDRRPLPHLRDHPRRACPSSWSTRRSTRRRSRPSSTRCYRKPPQQGDRPPRRPPAFARLRVRDAAPASPSAWITWSSRTRRHVLLGEAQDEVQRVIEQYQEGLITDGERYNKIVDIWAERRRQGHRRDDGRSSARRRSPTTETGKESIEPSFNPIYIMADSGARGSHAADPAARRDARPHGQALGRDHRDADHGELPRRSQRARSTSSRRTALVRASRTPRSRRRTPVTSRAVSSTSRRTPSSPSSTAARSTASA